MDDVCDRCGAPEYEVELRDVVPRSGDVLLLCPGCTNAELTRWDHEDEEWAADRG